jgi:hypothetical protein
MVNDIFKIGDLAVVQPGMEGLLGQGLNEMQYRAMSCLGRAPRLMPLYI